MTFRLTLIGLLFNTSLWAQHFRVQLMATEDSLPATYFSERSVKNVWCTRDEMGMYRYYLGSYATRVEAERVLRRLSTEYFPHARVVDLTVEALLDDQQRCGYFRGGPLPLAESDSVRFVYFDSGKAVLSEAGKRQVQPIIERLKAVPRSEVYILGYADAVGSSLANLELAAARARTVRNFLLDQDIEVGRIRVYAYGESEASAVEDTDWVESEYERAELRRRFRCAVVCWRPTP